MPHRSKAARTPVCFEARNKLYGWTFVFIIVRPKVMGIDVGPFDYRKVVKFRTSWIIGRYLPSYRYEEPLIIERNSYGVVIPCSSDASQSRLNIQLLVFLLVHIQHGNNEDFNSELPNQDDKQGLRS